MLPILLACGTKTTTMSVVTPIIADPALNDADTLKNKVINGAMQFDQGRQGAAYIAPRNAEIYSLDQWRICGGADGSWQTQRVPVSVDGFSFALKATVLQTQTIHTDMDNHHIEYPIEGRYIQSLNFGTPNAKDITISFWVRATKAGVKPFALMNGVNTESITTTYTVHQASTWEKVVITLSGEKQGTWTPTDWTFGMKLLWSLGTGTRYTGYGDALWYPYAGWNVPNTDQLLDEPVGSTLELTGVQLEIGNNATDFEHLPYNEELFRLERYFKVLSDGQVINTRLGGS